MKKSAELGKIVGRVLGIGNGTYRSYRPYRTYKDGSDGEVAVRIMEIKRFSFVLLRKRIPKDLRSLWRVPQ